MVALVQLGMLFCCTNEIVMDHYDFNVKPSPYFGLVAAKCICSAALHMWLYPHIFRSMDLMKYVLNHQEYFDHSWIPFFITLVNLMINISAEILNIYLLLYQKTVEYCIIHFVALEVIVEIPHFYSEALVDDKIKDRIFSKTHHLHVHNRGRDMSMSKRSCCNAMGRMFYCCFRLIYVSVIFYL